MKVMQIVSIRLRAKIVMWMGMEALPKKIAMHKGDDNQMVADYQKSASDAVQALLDVIAELSPETYQKFESKFTHMVQDTLRVKKTIDRRATNQLGLDL